MLQRKRRFPIHNEILDQFLTLFSHCTTTFIHTCIIYRHSATACSIWVRKGNKYLIISLLCEGDRTPNALGTRPGIIRSQYYLISWLRFIHHTEALAYRFSVYPKRSVSDCTLMLGGLQWSSTDL